MARKRKNEPRRPPVKRGTARKIIAKKFAKHLAAGKSGTAAYQASLDKPITPPAARVAAARLLGDPVVQEEVKKATTEALNYLQQDVNVYLEQLHAICTFDLADCYDEKGRILPLHKMPRHARMAISGFEVIMKNARAGDGVVDEVLKVRQWAKVDALLTMLKVRGEIVQRKETGKPGEFEKLDREQTLRKLTEETLPKLGLRLVKTG